MTKEPEFYRRKLDNGIIVIFEKRTAPVVAVASSALYLALDDFHVWSP